ncbi:hypothetical protein H4R19_001925 [Coemansia spiralis]|nr:hypothetical protein H4R19_001925 [Coemansia spiralis]
MGDIDTAKLTAVCAQIVREGDLDSLTDSVVRWNAESTMGLAAKVLDKQPYKKIVKDAVAATLASLSGDGEAAASSGKEEEEEEETTRQSSDGGGEDSLSDVDDEPAPVRAQKRGGSSKEKAPEKAKRAKTEGAASSSKTVTNLKNYIARCGVRKVWARELAGMSAAQQTRHLKGVLEGLGMEGRPTIEKCKRIKAKRDLQAELEEMDTDNIIDGAAGEAQSDSPPRRRRAASKKVSYNVDHISDSEDEQGGSGGEPDAMPGQSTAPNSDRESDGDDDDDSSAHSDAYMDDASGDNGSDDNGRKTDESSEAEAEEAAPDSDSAE